jgi:hypothetical protein
MRPRTLLALALLAVAAPTVRAADTNVISAVEVKDEGTAVVLSVKGTKKPSFTTFAMADPPRFVIDFSESRFQGVPEDIQVQDGTINVVKNLSYGSDATSIARVMIAFAVEVGPPAVEDVGGTLMVRIAKPAQQAADAQAAKGQDQAARAKADADAQARADADRQAREAAEAKSQAEAEQKAREAAEAKAQAEAEQKAREAAEAKAQAEAEQKTRDAAEAKTQAEAERKTREAAEAQARTEADAQARAAAEAKEKAERQARADADSAAKAQAEEQARRQSQRKAELDAQRAQAEAQARAAAEADAVAPEPAPIAKQPAPAPAKVAEKTAPTSAARLDAGAPSAKLHEVGFKQIAGVSRVFVRTSVTPRFTIQDVGENTIRVELENTRPVRKNDLRFMDTSFFSTAVALVTPSRRGSSYFLDIKLKQRVPYQQKIEGDVLAIDFERPAATASASVPAPSNEAPAAPAQDLAAEPADEPDATPESASAR